ncbi:MAG: helix-turn-helix domain-containing protein, partial [Candidatus Limnocylindrales bacterium]
MATNERSVDRAALRMRRSLSGQGEELRTARHLAGLSMAAVGRAVSISPAQVSRIERGLIRRLDLVLLAQMSAAVGLELSLRTYPAGAPIRDKGQMALLGRFRLRVSTIWSWNIEVGVRPGDPRAFDLVLRSREAAVAVEAETRLHDVQAQARRALAKRADGSVDRLVLLIADTRHNALCLRDARPLLAGDFPLDTRAVLRALAEGRDPGANGIAI